jgi:hypothetical protein
MVRELQIDDGKFEVDAKPKNYYFSLAKPKVTHHRIFE